VVQHQRAQALAPVDALRGWLWRMGLISVVVVGGVTTGLWLWMLRLLRRQDTSAHPAV
jgi:hypothetical protein